MRDDSVGEPRKWRSFFFGGGEIGIEERDDAAIRLFDHTALGLTDIAHADLHEFRDLRQLSNHVVKDRRMRPRESFICVAQVGVRVEMQNSHRWKSLRIRADRSERH